MHNIIYIKTELGNIKSNNNKYQENEILYINREKIIPTKLLVQDNNNNITIIIEYNEIELN